MNAEVFMSVHPELVNNIVSGEIQKEFINGSSKKQSMHLLQFEQMNLQIVDEQSIADNYKSQLSQLLKKAEELKADNLLDDAMVIIEQIKQIREDHMK